MRLHAVTGAGPHRAAPRDRPEMTDTAAAPPRTSLRALIPLLPYAWRYRLRIGAALVALTVASAATLTVPIAVRRMIDHGFSAEGAGLIDV